MINIIKLTLIILSERGRKQKTWKHKYYYSEILKL